MALISLNPDHPGLLVPGSVIRKQDLGLLSTAEELLAGVRHRSDEVHASLESLVAASREEGFQKGLEEGRAEAAAAHWKTVRETSRYLGTVQESLVDAVISCLRNLILELPPRERIIQLVGRAIADLNGTQRLTLSVSSASAPVATEALASLQGTFPGVSMELKIRPDLADDSCVLESPLGVVDASLESQLTAIRAGLEAIPAGEAGHSN